VAYTAVCIALLSAVHQSEPCEVMLRIAALVVSSFLRYISDVWCRYAETRALIVLFYQQRRYEHNSTWSLHSLHPGDDSVTAVQQAAAAR
jgi:hypothetical protein